MRDGSLYAFKGLAGKLGPIGVHAALLLCLFGTSWSGLGTLKGTVMCPEVRGWQLCGGRKAKQPVALSPAIRGGLVPASAGAAWRLGGNRQGAI